MKTIEFLSWEQADVTSATPESVYLAGGTEQQHQTCFCRDTTFHIPGYNPMPGAAARVTPKNHYFCMWRLVLLTRFGMRYPKRPLLYFLSLNQICNYTLL